MTDQDALRDQAVAWLVRLESDQASGEDYAALTVWLEASDAHLAAFEEAERLSASVSASAERLRTALGGRTAEVIAFPRPAPALRRPLFRLLAAASVAALAVMSGVFMSRAYWAPAQTYQTGLGQTREVALADGTRIEMDARSTLSARLDWRARHVNLEEGEASFDVAKDTHRPFIIRVADQRVRVLGTEFNIRHYDGASIVTVRRGVVEVFQDGDGAEPVARLTKGWSLRHVDGSANSQVSRTDPDTAFAWTQGRLICDDEPLPEIVAYLNRRYSVPIRLSDEAAKRRFSGVLALQNQQEVTRNLANYLSLSESRTAREILLR